MSDYNTGNPVPSIDPRDLDDNATVFDQLMNSTDSSVPDRLGVPRKTWYQVELDASALVSPNVTAIAAAGTPAANKLFYYTGSAAGAFADFTAQARTFNAAATQAAQLTVLGIPWAGATSSTAASDLDTINTTSILGVTSGTLNMPAGFTSGSMVSTEVFNSTSMIQVIKARASDLMSMRRMVSGVWQAWAPIAFGGANNTITSITGSAASLTTARSISATGDATWTVNFNGTANATAALTLAATGVGAGTYGTVTVNAKGLVTAGTVATPIANGGTGAITAPLARTALGAAASGANSDITSLSALSTPLTVAQGGTGIGTQTFANLTLSNSWVVLPGPPVRRAGYQKIADKFLYLEMNISSGTSTDGTTIATLPVGFRPVTDVQLAVSSGPNTPISSTVRSPSIQIVASTGVISCSNCSGTTGIMFTGVIQLA